MKRFALIVTIISVLLVGSYISNNNRMFNHSYQEYTVDDFIEDLQEEGYTVMSKSVDLNFLNTDSIRIEIDDIILDVYTFNNPNDMEKEASYIDEGGCSYNNGKSGVEVSWISYPHFFKKGNIIVQYIGDESGIVTELTDILGEQFAGFK